MKKILFFIIIAVVWNVHSVAQDISPDLLNATVVNDSGHVRLTWQRNDTTSASTRIQRDFYEAGAWAVGDIKIINDTSQIHWTDTTSKANSKTHIYKLSINLEGEGERESNYFNTIHTQLEFDTCEKKIELLWTRYVDKPLWKDYNDTISIKKYNIRKKVNNGSYSTIGTNGETDTTFTDENVNYNDTLKYYIEAVRASDTSIKSKSNRVSIYTRMPYDPDYINPDLLEVENNKTSLQYTIAENSELQKYKLLRAESSEGTYDTIHTFNTSENTLNYTDKEASPSENVYYYYMAAINQCNHLTTKSDTTNNIRLRLQQSENLDAVLNWNEFGIAPANISYQIFRKNGTNPYSELKHRYTTSYRDDELDYFSGRDSSGKFCYYIEGREQLNDTRSARSISTRECIYIKPRIFIPNAFSPNSPRTKNQTFKPVLSFLPQDYRLIIYNRKGNKVFETTNPEKPWRGYFRGQHKVSAGTYIYYLEVKNPDHELIKKRGEINVLYH